MCEPIIKWAGGKRQLIPKLKEKIPETFETYYEPFVGGGALFLELPVEKIVINDSNEQLINMYLQVKENLEEVIKKLKEIQDNYNNIENIEEKEKFYYKKRNQYNKYIKTNALTVESACLFIFLNKTGFNGLYRVNSKGEFNVPFAKKEKINLFNEENIKNVSKKINKSTIFCNDFEEICKLSQKDDLVFLDSPYYDTFDTYQNNGFKKEDHERLFKNFKEMTERGVKCILTNSNTDFIKNLYKDYNIEVVDVRRMINCNADKRTGKEIIVTNF